MKQLSIIFLNILPWFKNLTKKKRSCLFYHSGSFKKYQMLLPSLFQEISQRKYLAAHPVYTILYAVRHIHTYINIPAARKLYWGIYIYINVYVNVHNIVYLYLLSRSVSYLIKQHRVRTVATAANWLPIGRYTQRYRYVAAVATTSASWQ